MRRPRAHYLLLRAVRRGTEEANGARRWRWLALPSGELAGVLLLHQSSFMALSVVRLRLRRPLPHWDAGPLLAFTCVHTLLRAAKFAPHLCNRRRAPMLETNAPPLALAPQTTPRRNNQSMLLSCHSCRTLPAQCNGVRCTVDTAFSCDGLCPCGAPVNCLDCDESIIFHIAAIVCTAKNEMPLGGGSGCCVLAV